MDLIWIAIQANCQKKNRTIRELWTLLVHFMILRRIIDYRYNKSTEIMLKGPLSLKHVIHVYGKIGYQ